MIVANLEINRIRLKWRVKLIADTGISNVTGFSPLNHDMAEIAPCHGSKSWLTAHLAPYQVIEVGALGAHRSPDYVASSAHKMNALKGDVGAYDPLQYSLVELG